MRYHNNETLKEFFKSFFIKNLMAVPSAQNDVMVKSTLITAATWAWEDCFNLLLSLEEKAYKRGYAAAMRSKSDAKSSNTSDNT